MTECNDIGSVHDCVTGEDCCGIRRFSKLRSPHPALSAERVGSLIGSWVRRRLRDVHQPGTRTCPFVLPSLRLDLFVPCPVNRSVADASSLVLSIILRCPVASLFEEKQPTVTSTEERSCLEHDTIVAELSTGAAVGGMARIAFTRMLSTSIIATGTAPTSGPLLVTQQTACFATDVVFETPARPPAFCLTRARTFLMRTVAGVAGTVPAESAAISPKSISPTDKLALTTGRRSRRD